MEVSFKPLNLRSDWQKGSPLSSTADCFGVKFNLHYIELMRKLLQTNQTVTHIQQTSLYKLKNLDFRPTFREQLE
jgi:hypothetical protein